jgi:hypothetical protein
VARLQLFELEQLDQARLALGAPAVELAPELLDQQPELADRGFRRQSPGLRLGRLRPGGANSADQSRSGAR